MALDTLPIDRIRVGLKLAQHYVNHVQDAQAEAELKTLRELYPMEAQPFRCGQSPGPHCQSSVAVQRAFAVMSDFKRE